MRPGNEHGSAEQQRKEGATHGPQSASRRTLGCLTGPTLVCDPGVDDVVALAVLVGLGAAPAAVVATDGNVAATTSARVAAGACALLGLEVPVLVAGGGTVRSGSRHGPDGFVGLGSQLPPAPPAAPLGSLAGDLLVTGPLTVVARHPVRGRVLWLGGGFNEEADPTAAGRVRCEVVPVPVSGRVVLPLDDLDGPPLLVEAVRRFGPVVHDAVAAVAWCRPHLFAWQGGVAVEVDEPAVVGQVGDALASVPWVR